MKKLNKKGFTLIELLAVIAILAILIVIAVPGVLNMYNNAKEQTFVTQAKSIYKAAEQKFLADQLAEASDSVTYCNETTSGTNQLGISNANVAYKIVMTASGATSFQVSDGTNSITCSSNCTISKITAVDASPVASITCP